MTTNSQILTSGLFQNVNQLIAAADRVGLPLWIATAFVERESHGQNIYGHDAGGTFQGHGEVTQNNYAQFYDSVIVHHGRSNGVGPMQITWSGFLIDAEKRGIHLWDVNDNFAYGFALIAGYLHGNYSNASISAAGKSYNGSADYGVQVAARAAYWHPKLTPFSVVTTKATLRYGSTGTAVGHLQSGLNKAFPSYSNLSVDGVFGHGTEKVVVDFQTRTHIGVDGVVGPATRAKLATFGVTF